MASRLLTEIRGQNPPPFTERLLDWIPRVSPKLDAPTWLAPYVDTFERAVGGGLRLVFAAPPQHGKTVATTHGLAYLEKRFPGRRHAYATYSQDRARRVSLKSIRIAEEAGLGGKLNQDFWLFPTGGQIVWTSRRGGLTGEPVDGVAVVDDILKDRLEAESAKTRADAVDWLDDVVEPRVHPGGSIIVMATRWHPDDLSGVLIRRGYQYINLKALADADDPLGRKPGEALCEARQPREALERKRSTNIYSFASLYQGEPRPRGGTIFREPTYYSELPQAYRVGYGVDLAYTKKTIADWSVCVELWCDRRTEKPTFYVKGVDRKQVDAPSFTLTLRSRHSTRSGPMLWYAYGAEVGVGDFVKQKIPALQVKSVGADKVVRSQRVSEAWNDGRVLVPATPEGEKTPAWLDDFLAEVLTFTGVNDSNDDQVDALAAAHDVFGLNEPITQDFGPNTRWADSPGRGF